MEFVEVYYDPSVLKLYVCWTTNEIYGTHACGNAYIALKELGHDPEVVKAYGWRVLPEVMNKTKGRVDVKDLTGDITVPVLVTDDGEVVKGSKQIEEWAMNNVAR